MSFKHLMLSVLVAVAMAKIATCCTPPSTEIERAYQNVFSGLYGVEHVIRLGTDSTTIQQATKPLLKELHSITEMYAAQNALSESETSIDLAEFLDIIVQNACTLIKVKAGDHIPCSSYSDILDLKLALDIYNIQEEARDELENSTDLRLRQCQEDWLSALPCEHGSTPFEIISSLPNYDYTCVAA